MPRVNMVAWPVPSHDVNMSGGALGKVAPWHSVHSESGMMESPEPPPIAPRHVPAVIVMVLPPSVRMYVPGRSTTNDGVRLAASSSTDDAPGGNPVRVHALAPPWPLLT